MFIDLPPQTQAIIAQVARQNNQSLHDFIVMSAYEKALQSMATQEFNDKDKLGERIHQIFAKADYPKLTIAPRTDYPREIKI